MARYFFPRLQDILFLSLLAAVILYGPRLFNQDGDLGRHITIGNYILETGKTPLNDIFSHTMQGERLVPHEWLSQVLFALANKAMGLDGDVLLTALVVASTFMLVFKETVRRTQFRLTGLVIVLLAAAASSLHWLARPHIFTLLLLAIWTFELEKRLAKPDGNILIFPVLMLIWANSHGAFIAGFVVLGIYFFEWLIEFRLQRASAETGRRLALIGGTSLLSTFINPAGWHLWTTSLGYIGNNYLVSHTVEYMPPNFHNPGTWPFLFLLALSLSALAWGGKLRLREGLLLAAWALMGLYSARNIPLFAIISAPILAELVQAPAGKLHWLARLEAGLGQIEMKAGGFFWPILGLASAILLYSQHLPLDLSRQGNVFNPAVFPVAASKWLEANPQQGKVFNYFNWGGYLLFRFWPEYPVFIDGQTDFYGEKLTREYEVIISTAPGWQDLLNQHRVSWAILPANSPLVDAMEEAGWQKQYWDETSAILRKR